jgi:signal transduction histidine kinase
LRLFSDEIVRTKAGVAVDVSSEWVLGDPTGVERVLVNLFGNALKFTQPGRSPVIRVSADPRNGNVRISVQDNGVGLDPKYRERIFGVFEHLSSTGSATGTGIGLAIVKRSVEKMGGTVGVESELGKGSCFWFELPKADGPVAPAPGTRTISGQLPEQKTNRLVGHMESDSGE